MIGGEPYTLGLFDTAGEKSSVCIIVTPQLLVVMMLNTKTCRFFFFYKREKSLFHFPELLGVAKLSSLDKATNLLVELFYFVTLHNKFQTFTSNSGITWWIRGFVLFKQK